MNSVSRPKRALRPTRAGSQASMSSGGWVAWCMTTILSGGLDGPQSFAALERVVPRSERSSEGIPGTQPKTSAAAGHSHHIEAAPFR